MNSKDNKKDKEDKKDEEDKLNREFILNANMWILILKLCIPLAIYQSSNQIFKMFDAQMASHISSYAMSAVSYVSQISLMIASVGVGLSMGSSLKVSEAYGAGDYTLMKKRIANMYLLNAILAVLAIMLIPFSNIILKFMNMPQELLNIGKSYFIIDLIATAISFINITFISIERARGNSKVILYLNLTSVILKFLLSYFMIYKMNYGIASIAIATLATQIVLFVIAIVRNIRDNRLFCFDYHYLSKEKNITPPMVKLSIPVIFEKISFSFGKVIINSMSATYGVITVGALSVTNNISGMTTAPQNGFQEGGAAIISQNLGANKYDRAVSAFKVILIYNLIIGIIGFFISMVYVHQIAALFAPTDSLLQSMIVHIYRYEAFGAIALGIGVSVTALLYGYGMTRLTFVMNFCRLFVFRIPVLFVLQQYTTIGYQAVGIVMMVSNISVAVMSIVIGIYVIKRINREGKNVFI